MHRLIQCCLLLGLILHGGCASVTASSVRAQAAATLTAIRRTEHFDIHYQPDSRTAAHIRRLAVEVEGELARICARLEVANDTRYQLMVFDDIETVAKAMGDPRLGGLTWEGTAYLTLANDGARFHEMIHLVADAKVGSSKSRFSAEGLAVALLDEMRYRDMHAAAKRYAAQKRLPPLASLVRLNPTAGHKLGISLYETAGSWMRFLYDTHGAAKLKRYYMGHSVESVYGVSLAQLERDWHAVLERHVSNPEVATYTALTDGRAPESMLYVEGDQLGLLIRSGQDESVARYQWRRNGAVIPGATQSNIDLGTLTPADSGIYSLAFSDSADGDGFVMALRVVPRTEVDRPPEEKALRYGVIFGR